MLRGATDDPCWQVAPKTNKKTSPIDGCRAPASCNACELYELFVLSHYI